MKVKEIRDIITNKLLAYEVNGKVVSRDSETVKKWVEAGGTVEKDFSEADRKRYLIAIKKANLKSCMSISLSNGMLSKMIGKKVNSRLEDIMNVRLLLDFMHLKGLMKIRFRLFDNSYATLTVDEVKNVYHELLSHYMSMRYKKWTLDGLIAVSDDIDWDENLRRRFPHETKKEVLNGSNSKPKTK